MLLLELLCLAIIAIHVSVGAFRFPSTRTYLRRVGLVALASWIAEDTCLRMYGFYAYHPDWFPYIDRMPLMVVLIWPGVLLSAQELAGLLLGKGRMRWLPLVGGLMVFADASFMEPLAVKAGLWEWFQPGYFGVPPVGVAGWAYFSATCMAIFARSDARGGWRTDLWVVLIGPLATHLALLASWWGLFRWVNVAFNSWAVVALAWAVSLFLTGWAVRNRARRLVPPGAMVTRIPAAIFFFALLVLHGRGDPALVAYALAFAPPYIALTRFKTAV